MVDFALTPQQIQVIDALSSGATLTEAAQQAGVHRNSINHWRRNHLLFQHALSHAQYDRALLVREQAEQRVNKAFATLDRILDDPHAPASVVLKASLFIIEKAANPPLPKKQVELDIEKIHLSSQPSQPVDFSEVEAARRPEAPENAPEVNNSAQSASHPQQPPHLKKIGRNEPCPCHSGKKYKYCCLNHPQPRAAA